MLLVHQNSLPQALRGRGLLDSARPILDRRSLNQQRLLWVLDPNRPVLVRQSQTPSVFVRTRSPILQVVSLMVADLRLRNGVAEGSVTTMSLVRPDTVMQRAAAPLV